MAKTPPAFYLDQFQTIIDRRFQEWEADWLNEFMPILRPHDVEFDFFPLEKKPVVTLETFTHLDVQALPVFWGAQSARGDHLGFNGFVKGAAAVTTLLSSNEADRAGHLLEMQMEVMREELIFPAVDERFLAEYVDVASAILLTEEYTVWRNLLAFNAGVWWMMGFLAGTPAHLKAGVKSVHKILLVKAKLGAIDV